MGGAGEGMKPPLLVIQRDAARPALVSCPYCPPQHLRTLMEVPASSSREREHVETPRQQEQHAVSMRGGRQAVQCHRPSFSGLPASEASLPPCAASLTRHDLVGVGDGGVELQDGVHSGAKLDANGRQRVAA